MLKGETYTVHIGSNLDVLPTLEDNSIDSIVTDPPYELGFMGKKWDSSGIAYSVELWKECLRVLKPGGHLLSFGGTRTWHRVAVAIEDAGFEVRDSIAWMYGSGFPKSLDVSKAIDKAAGAERNEVLPQGSTQCADYPEPCSGHAETGKFSATVHALPTAPATAEAKQWEGWGTALKPAFEPIVVARKPLIGTVAENVLTHGTGGLNIDGSRIGTEGGAKRAEFEDNETNSVYGKGLGQKDAAPRIDGLGRWPANVILDEYSAEILDEQSDASRFFYVAKASKRDRNEGLDELPISRPDTRTSTGMGTFEEKGVQPQRNFHPTVKPTDLMRYLVKLVTPPNGTVLDPFTGSGSTGKAAILEGFRFIGIELTEDYIPIIEGRLNHAEQLKAEQQDKDKEQLF